MQREVIKARRRRPGGGAHQAALRPSRPVATTRTGWASSRWTTSWTWSRRRRPGTLSMAGTSRTAALRGADADHRAPRLPSPWSARRPCSPDSCSNDSGPVGRRPLLLAFVPVITRCRPISSQASTVAVRGLASGRIGSAEADTVRLLPSRQLWSECRSGLRRAAGTPRWRSTAARARHVVGSRCAALPLAALVGTLRPALSDRARPRGERARHHRQRHHRHLDLLLAAT
jgi:hypothetical protein